MKMCCIAILLLSTGCAMVLKRSGEPIVVQSTPDGADAAIQCVGNVRASGVTPATVTIPRAADGCGLSISKQGFTPRVVPLARGDNGAYWSNLALLSGIQLALFVVGEVGAHSVTVASA